MPDASKLVWAFLTALALSFMLVFAGALDPSIGILPGACVAMMVTAAYVFIQSLPVLDMAFEPHFHRLVAALGNRTRNVRDKSVATTLVTGKGSHLRPGIGVEQTLAA